MLQDNWNKQSTLELVHNHEKIFSRKRAHQRFGGAVGFVRSKAVCVCVCVCVWRGIHSKAVQWPAAARGRVLGTKTTTTLLLYRPRRFSHAVQKVKLQDAIENFQIYSFTETYVLLRFRFSSSSLILFFSRMKAVSLFLEDNFWIGSSKLSGGTSKSRSRSLSCDRSSA